MSKIMRYPLPCSTSAVHGSYLRRHSSIPFVDGKVEDLNPVFDKVCIASNDGIDIPCDPDRYAGPFMPVDERVVGAAEEGERIPASDEILSPSQSSISHRPVPSQSLANHRAIMEAR